ncbi:MAG: hypothetical protein HQM11_07840 [SAR324 cluster bacterium]|nr:hypothetical protein [SAR324 cluster bacterium]
MNYSLFNGNAPTEGVFYEVLALERVIVEKQVWGLDYEGFPHLLTYEQVDQLPEKAKYRCLYALEEHGRAGIATVYEG